jgi:hypothetical protein
MSRIRKICICGGWTYGTFCKKCSPTMSSFHHTEDAKRRQRESKLAEKNPMWVGDNIKSLPSLHRWIERRMPKPLICPRCNERPTLDLSNKGIYDRNLENWEWLCRRCHMLSDGRFKNLKSTR